jgi:hypothetical protein
MLTKPALLLRIEGSLLFAVSIVCYHETHASWILFAVLLLAPDLSMAGYLANVKIGATMYNAVHTLTGPLLISGGKRNIGASSGRHKGLFQGGDPVPGCGP